MITEITHVNVVIASNAYVQTHTLAISSVFTSHRPYTSERTSFSDCNELHFSDSSRVSNKSRVIVFEAKLTTWNKARDIYTDIYTASDLSPIFSEPKFRQESILDKRPVTVSHLWYRIPHS